MSISDLLNSDLKGVLEIQCNESVYHELLSHVGLEISENDGRTTFKGIPVTVDNTITKSDGCYLIYDDHEYQVFCDLMDAAFHLGNELIDKNEEYLSEAEKDFLNALGDYLEYDFEDNDYDEEHF